MRGSTEPISSLQVTVGRSTPRFLCLLSEKEAKIAKEKELGIYKEKKVATLEQVDQNQHQPRSSIQVSPVTDQQLRQETGPDPSQHRRRGHREDAGAEEALLQDQLQCPEGPRHQARRQPGPRVRVPEDAARSRPQRASIAAEPQHAAQHPGKEVGGVRQDAVELLESRSRSCCRRHDISLEAARPIFNHTGSLCSIKAELERSPWLRLTSSFPPASGGDAFAGAQAGFAVSSWTSADVGA